MQRRSFYPDSPELGCFTPLRRLGVIQICPVHSAMRTPACLLASFGPGVQLLTGRGRASLPSQTPRQPRAWMVRGLNRQPDQQPSVKCAFCQCAAGAASGGRQAGGGELSVGAHHWRSGPDDDGWGGSHDRRLFLKQESRLESGSDTCNRCIDLVCMHMVKLLTHG